MMKFFPLFVLTIVTQFSSVALALTNSQPALDDVYQSEVWYGSDGQEPDGSSVTGYCNGTLLSSTIMVTAAHCVQQAWVLKSNQIQIEVGKYIYVTKPNGQVVRIGYGAYLNKTVETEFLFSQEAQQKILSDGMNVVLAPELDQAVIRLKTPLELPANFPYRKMVARAALEQITHQLMQYSPMVCAVNPVAYISTTDSKRMADLDQIDFHNADHDSGYFKSRSTAKLEEGDSGSGMLVKVGNEYQLLAVSRGEVRQFLMTTDLYNLAAGPVCDIALSAGLTGDEQAVLCR